jgi:hypothetical protein
VFEKRVLRGIFGPEGNEVIEGRRKLHEELCSLYSSSNTIRMIKLRRLRWAEYIACIGEMKSAYRILVEKPGGKRPPGRLGSWRNYNIKVEFREVAFGGVDWICLTSSGQGLVAGSCGHGNKPSGSVKGGEFLD